MCVFVCKSYAKCTFDCRSENEEENMSETKIQLEDDDEGYDDDGQGRHLSYSTYFLLPSQCFPNNQLLTNLLPPPSCVV